MSIKRPRALVQPSAAMKPCFRASVNTAGEFELLIYEEIGQDWWSDSGVTAKSVRDELDRAGTYSKIVVRINSPGGDAFEGIAIGNVLKASGRPIEVYIDGIAASAASIVAMCGASITMAHNSMMMIHNAWSICMGEASDMRKMADTLEKISQSIAQTYVDRTGKTLAEVTALMDAETWLSAEECLENGFATAIAAESNEPAMAMARSFKVLGKLKHVPEALKPDLAAKKEPGVAAKAPAEAKNAIGSCSCSCEECVEGECSACTNADCTDKNCMDCPMQNDAETENSASNLNLFQSRQWEMEKGIRPAV